MGVEREDVAEREGREDDRSGDQEWRSDQR